MDVIMYRRIILNLYGDHNNCKPLLKPIVQDMIDKGHSLYIITNICAKDGLF